MQAQIDPTTPPPGIPPLVWLVVFLLIGPPALMSKAGAKLPGILGAAGRWWQNRTPTATSYRVSQEELKRVVDNYARLRADYDEILAWKTTMETQLTTANRRFWAAVAYIRRLIDALGRHAPDAEMPPPPEMLRDIV